MARMLRRPCLACEGTREHRRSIGGGLGQTETRKRISRSGDEVGKWKLLCEYDGSEPQLYDLVSDPIESENLAATELAQVKRMTEQLLEWNAAVPSDPRRGAGC